MNIFVSRCKLIAYGDFFMCCAMRYALVAGHLQNYVFLTGDGVRVGHISSCRTGSRVEPGQVPVRRFSPEVLLWHIAAQSPRHYGVVPVRRPSPEVLLWPIAAQSPRHYGVVPVRRPSPEALLWHIAAQSLRRNSLLALRHEEVPGAGAQNGLRLFSLCSKTVGS